MSTGVNPLKYLPDNYPEPEVQHQSGKPNITLPLLHNVKGDSQSQSVTTFTSCKMWPDKFHIVQKLKKFNIEENQISYRQGQPKPKCDNFYIM
jgi:hypothetical protein